ncbi:MAG TPA: class I SAM-dependent methyltransferase [Opitutaceae bacterium]|nr:class I SAM-dependent methyltransferase [Opitutaceae bacterium]
MNTSNATPGEYHYGSADAAHTSDYLWKPILAACAQFGAKRVLDLGCGNGAFCRELAHAGFSAVGCDPSGEGIRIASESVPGATFKQLGVDDDPTLLGERGFDIVVSTEVVEHLAMPRHLPQFAKQVLRPGGLLIVSTPYHGYLKNLMLSLTDKWDDHLSPFWDGGHIKLWSRATLTRLLEEEGFRVTKFIGAGRFPWLWMSMILVAEKPSGD